MRRHWHQDRLSALSLCHTNDLKLDCRGWSIDKSQSPGDSEAMSEMLRITSSTMMLFFRLVVVLSLAGYSVSAVNAAMHPSSSASASLNDAHSVHVAHEDSATSVDGPHADQVDEASSDKSGSTCCQDFCGVFAITCAMPKIAHPVVVSMKGFINDIRTFGESPALHRPPNI